MSNANRYSMNPDLNVSDERLEARREHEAADALIRLGNQRERLKTLRLTLEQQVGRVRVFAEGLKPHAVAQDILDVCDAQMASTSWDFTQDKR